MTQKLFITGFQKSGTSLVNRVLMAQDWVDNPFLPEGKFFWGDDPVDNPSAAPCGECYQNHQGRRGHQLLACDFQAEHQALLEQRVIDAEVTAPVLMNKNPNLIVRLPWLKRMFPESKVVVVLRDPIPNLYSFSKKLHVEKQHDPNFWWGVKPDNWTELIDPDALVQITAQWRAVFGLLLEQLDHVDGFIHYREFCEQPEQHILHLSELLGVSPQPIHMPFNQLRCMDDEFQHGGSLDSKNILLRREKTFEISASNLQDKSYAPFSTAQVDLIQAETSGLWSQLLNQIGHEPD